MKGQFKINNESFKPMNRLNIKKEKIIELSVEKFNDEDPCIINETFCRNYIARKLIMFIENYNEEYIEKKIKFREMNEKIKEMLEYNEKDEITFK